MEQNPQSHEFNPNRRGLCKFTSKIGMCHQPEDARPHQNWLRRVQEDEDWQYQIEEEEAERKRRFHPSKTPEISRREGPGSTISLGVGERGREEPPACPSLLKRVLQGYSPEPSPKPLKIKGE